MYFDAERETVETTLGDGFTEVPISWANIAPKRVNEYVHPVIQSGKTSQITMGGVTKAYRRIGVVTFQIFVPKNSGTKRSREIGDLISGLFMGKQIDDIIFENVEFAHVGDVEESFQSNVVVTYKWTKCV
jgi:hypothetical protein